MQIHYASNNICFLQQQYVMLPAQETYNISQLGLEGNHNPRLKLQLREEKESSRTAGMSTLSGQGDKDMASALTKDSNSLNTQLQKLPQLVKKQSKLVLWLLWPKVSKQKEALLPAFQERPQQWPVQSHMVNGCHHPAAELA